MRGSARIPLAVLQEYGMPSRAAAFGGAARPFVDSPVLVIPRPRTFRRLAGLALFLLGSFGCAAGRDEASAPPAAGFEPTPTRGYLLISIDTLRADRIGAWGYEKGTTPFLDTLAARGTLFERAIAQIPATLQSHLSIFTGLYPREHGVMHPIYVLAPEIPLVSELFHDAGFRTAGFTEGGYMKGYHGFQRGYEVWSDENPTAETDVERTFARGLDFLRGLAPDERFLLFLHTYAVHDPYEPPAAHRERFWPGPPPAGAFPPTGPELARVNEREIVPDPEVVTWLSALYDGSIHYVDSVLASLFAELERTGLLAETTVILFSDHGEEFFEHGRLSHTQTYHELLHVPLLLLHPAQREPLRIRSLVEGIDIAPTLLDLAGLPAPPMSGRSLVPLLRAPGAAGSDRAFAEGVSRAGGVSRVRYRASGHELLQLIHTRPEADRDGAWITRRLVFDTSGKQLAFDAVGFPGERSLAVTIDGRDAPALWLGGGWQRLSLDLGGPGPHRVALEADSCRSPHELGLGDDPRCFSFKIAGFSPERWELFDLAADPHGRHDLSRRRSTDTRALRNELRAIVHTPRAAGSPGEFSDEQIQALRALGYLR